MVFSTPDSTLFVHDERTSIPNLGRGKNGCLVLALLLVVDNSCASPLVKLLQPYKPVGS